MPENVLGNTPGRRRILAAAAGALVALTLAACGAGGSAPASSASSPDTRSITTAKGQVTIPAHPQRVVAINPQVRANLFDLGVKPAGVYNEGDTYISPRYKDAMNGIPVIGTGGKLDLEKIAAAKPDLIIGVDYAWNTDSYDQLKAIAPTVIAPATGWQSVASTTADAVGETGKLDELKAKFTAQAQSVKKDYAAQLASTKVDLIQGGFDSGKYWLYGAKSDAGDILSQAGVTFASGSAAITDAANQALSYENIDKLSDAGLIAYYSDFDGSPNNEGPALFAQAGFKALPAVKAGNTVAIPSFLPNGYGDAMSVLDEFVVGLKKLPAKG